MAAFWKETSMRDQPDFDFQLGRSIRLRGWGECGVSALKAVTGKGGIAVCAVLLAGCVLKLMHLLR
jgi:hypothetical protein